MSLLKQIDIDNRQNRTKMATMFYWVASDFRHVHFVKWSLLTNAHSAVQCPGWSPSKVLTEHVSPKLEPDGRAGQVELSNFDINIRTHNISTRMLHLKLYTFSDICTVQQRSFGFKYLC